MPRPDTYRVTRTRMASMVLLGALAVGGIAGCSSSDPVKAEASVITGGLSAGADVQVTAALAATSAAVKGWQIENAAYPTAAEFGTIPGAAGSGGATITYSFNANGFCLTGTSASQPPVVRTWKEPGGLQPVGSSC